MQQALRLWNRAADTISRLAAPPQPPKPAAEPSNPFEVPSAKDAPTAATSDPPNAALAFSKKSFGRGLQNDGVEWRIAEGLLETLFWLVEIYFARGSAREASYFAQSAQNLAESLGAPAMVSRALARKGEIELGRKQLQEAHHSLADATDLVQSLSGTDTADLLRLQGEYHSRSEQPQDAQQLYERSAAIVEELDMTLSAVEVLPNR
jgi:separase